MYSTFLDTFLSPVALLELDVPLPNFPRVRFVLELVFNQSVLEIEIESGSTQKKPACRAHASSLAETLKKTCVCTTCTPYYVQFPPKTHRHKENRTVNTNENTNTTTTTNNKKRARRRKAAQARRTHNFSSQHTCLLKLRRRALLPCDSLSQEAGALFARDDGFSTMPTASTVNLPSILRFVSPDQPMHSYRRRLKRD